MVGSKVTATADSKYRKPPTPSPTSSLTSDERTSSEFSFAFAHENIVQSSAVRDGL